eukprot:m.187412 g.187412  ORF g.187412 m.187412 type:complete len:606 (-) comp14774_c0_seq3:5973-7790(-)
MDTELPPPSDVEGQRQLLLHTLDSAIRNLELMSKRVVVIKDGTDGLADLWRALELCLKHDSKFSSESTYWSALEGVLGANHELVVKAQNHPSQHTPVGKARVLLRLLLQDRQLGEALQKLQEKRSAVRRYYHSQSVMRYHACQAQLVDLVYNLNTIQFHLPTSGSLDKSWPLLSAQEFKDDPPPSSSKQSRAPSRGSGVEARSSSQPKSDSSSMTKQVDTVNALRKQLEQLQMDNRQAEERIKSLELDAESLEELNAQLKQDTTTLSRTISDLKQALAAKDAPQADEDPSAQLLGDLAESSVAASATASVDDAGQHAELLAELETVRTELAVVQQHYSELEQRQAGIGRSHSSEMQNYQSRLTEQAATIKAKEQQIKTLQAEAKDSQSHAESKMAELDKQAKSAIIKYERLKGEVESYKQYIQQIEEAQKEMEAKLRDVRQQSEERHRQWLREQKSKDEHKKARQDLVAAFKVLLQKYQNDADAAKCLHCAAPFSLTFRRHHCRLCGQVFCEACTSHLITFSSYPKPVRSCENCKHALTLLRQEVDAPARHRSTTSTSAQRSISGLSPIARSFGTGSRIGRESPAPSSSGRSVAGESTARSEKRA